MSSSLHLFTSFLKRVDIFGSLIQFNYKRDTTLKTQFGGILTVLMMFMGVFLIYFFGKDIILKDKPFITYTRIITQGDSEVLLSEFPIMFKLTTPTGELLPIDTLFHLTVDLLALDKQGRYEVIPDVASLTPCDPEKHYGIYKEFLMLNSTELPKNLLCVSPFNNETKFINDYGSTNSKSLYIKFMECDSKRHNKTCAPKAEINKWLGEFLIQTYFVDWFIDPTNYSIPAIMYLNSGSQRVTNELYTRKYYILKKTNITTDTGLFFDDFNTQQVRKLELAYIDIYLYERDPTEKYAVTWESMTLGEVYQRTYVKIFDILAKLGGLMNLILQVGKVFCQYTSETSFYLQQAKDLVNFDDFDDSAEVNTKDFDIEKFSVVAFNTSLKKAATLKNSFPLEIDKCKNDSKDKVEDLDDFASKKIKDDLIKNIAKTTNNITQHNESVSTPKLLLDNNPRSVARSIIKLSEKSNEKPNEKSNLRTKEKSKEKEKINKTNEKNNITTDSNQKSTNSPFIDNELNDTSLNPKHKPSTELVLIKAQDLIKDESQDKKVSFDSSVKKKKKEKEDKVEKYLKDIKGKDKNGRNNNKKLSVKNIENYRNSTVYRDPAANIGYIDYLKKTCGPNKKDTFGYNFYTALINHFEKYLDIAHVVRTNYDVEMIKYLLLSHLNDFDDLFKIKISIQDILAEELEKSEDDEDDQIEMKEKAKALKRKEASDLQKKLKHLFQSLRRQLMSKKILEDNYKQSY